MVLNYIWIAFFLVAFVVALVKLIFLGDVDVFPNMINSTFAQAKTGFELSLGLTGVLALWMGIMKIGEKGGVVNVMARLLGPLFHKFFPEIPKGHPVTGTIFMNLSANMLNLDNAATPMGLKAMEQLDEIKNERIEKLRKEKNLDEATVTRMRQTATNPMIMFLVLNTSGLTLIPVSILVYRAQSVTVNGEAMTAANPTDVFIPILLATFFSTLVGLLVTSFYQRINLLNRTVVLALGGICCVMASVIWAFNSMDAALMNTVSISASSITLMAVIVGFIVAGMRKRVNVYDAFIEGAKDGFTTAVRIIPYLVAILVAVGVFRASGAMDWIIDGIGSCVKAVGMGTDFVGALPTALMKPLSGGGARGMMIDAMQTYGPDSFTARLACIFQGSTDTTFYILAVYFGSVGIRFTRHAVTCGLMADAAGIIAALVIAGMFFG